MAFRKKAAPILACRPDVLIVPECEHPDKMIFADETMKPKHALWFGDNQHKGLGVFSYGNYKIKMLDDHNAAIKTILPIEISTGNFRATLLAIWAFNADDKDYVYVGQVWKGINYYERLLKRKNVLLAGDFNSNAIWDKPNKKATHSMVVERLKKFGIQSTYHLHTKEKEGKESAPTFFLYRHKDKPYHLDYCFASQNLIRRLDSVEIGSFEQWRSLSDHKPVITTFDI